jgi:hypothetical protein
MTLTELKLARLRGFAGTATIPLTRKPGGPAASLVLFGDNGTGKSSITNALEFVLQNRVLRDRPRLDGLRCALQNAPPYVHVRFSDGTEFERKMVQDDDGNILTSPPSAHPRFTRAPVVLHRADIHRFWSTNALQRLMVFSDFSPYEPSVPSPHEVPQLDFHADSMRRTLEAERYEAKKERREIAQQLATRLRMPVDEVPLTRTGLNDFIRTRVYGGLTRKQRDALARRWGATHTVDDENARLATRLKTLTADVQKYNSELQFFKDPSKSGGANAGNLERLAGVAVRIAQTAEAAFKAISPSSDLVDKVSIAVARETRVSLEIELLLTNGKTCRPAEVLSEANLDLLAFTLYFGLCAEAVAMGQPALWILDDVFQSIDATMRLRAFEWLVDETPTWQLIITAHERLWAEQVMDAMRRRSRPVMLHHLKKWSVADGATLVCNVALGPLEGLQEALARRDVRAICGAAGVALEQGCEELSFALPCAVPRRRGERYTLGDLWPLVKKKLAKTNLADRTDAVHRLLALRNLVGAHYNSWAGSLSDQEATDFGESVRAFLACVWCGSCFAWISPVTHGGNTISYRCLCGLCEVK